jgi:hypothetical protein
VLRDHPELGPIGRLTWRESLWCVRLALWDERQHRLVSFRDARALRDAGQPCKDTKRFRALSEITFGFDECD